MSSKLKQAAQHALDAFEAFGEADDFATLFTLTQKMNALRTAIQQADTKTGEPIYQICKADSVSVHSAWVDVDKQAYDDAGLYPEYRRRMLYTHPAPGVPDGWMLVKFDDMVRLASLIGPAPFEQDGKTYTFNVPNPDENLRLISATVRAMLAASQAQKT